MALTQQQAANALGISRRSVVGYERSLDEGGLPVPRAIELACWALSKGTTHYEGPDVSDGEQVLLKLPAKLLMGESLSPEIVEWCRGAGLHPVTVRNGTATFQSISDAVLFKLTWF